MTNWVEWFRDQLKSSGDGFAWAFSQVTPSHRRRIPPDPGYMGTWSPARLVWHVTEYERCLALPSMRQWLGGSMPGENPWPDDDATWLAAESRCSDDDLIAAFHAVRQEQIQLLDKLESIDWTAPHETLWGHKPLAMIVTKTYQHTFEHGDTLLRIGLWWPDDEAELAQKAQ